MKVLSFTPLLLIAACASRPVPQILIKPGHAGQPVESVRYAEVIRAYHLGRYADPNHPQIMHEQHPVYRVEAHTRWNLKPGDSCVPSISPLNPPPDAAHSPPPTNDVVLAELSRQKDATERVMWEAFQLARSYDDLQKVIKDMASVAKINSFMNARIINTEIRVGEFEQELKKLMAPPPAPTNDIPGLFIEKPEPPKP